MLKTWPEGNEYFNTIIDKTKGTKILKELSSLATEEELNNNIFKIVDKRNSDNYYINGYDIYLNNNAIYIKAEDIDIIKESSSYQFNQSNNTTFVEYIKLPKINDLRIDLEEEIEYLIFQVTNNSDESLIAFDNSNNIIDFENNNVIGSLYHPINSDYLNLNKEEIIAPNIKIEPTDYNYSIELFTVEDAFVSNKEIINVNLLESESSLEYNYNTIVSLKSLKTNRVIIHINNKDISLYFNNDQGNIIPNSLKLKIELKNFGFKTIDNTSYPINNINEIFSINTPINGIYIDEWEDDLNVNIQLINNDNYNHTLIKEIEWISDIIYSVQEEIEINNFHETTINIEDYNIDDNVEITGIDIINNNPNTNINYIKTSQNKYKITTLPDNKNTIKPIINEGYLYIYEDTANMAKPIDEFYLYSSPEYLSNRDLYASIIAGENKGIVNIIANNEYYFDEIIKGNSPIHLFGIKNNKIINLRRVFFVDSKNNLTLTNTEYKKPIKNTDQSKADVDYIINLDFKDVNNIYITYNKNKINYQKAQGSVIEFKEEDLNGIKDELKITYQLKNSFILDINYDQKNIGLLKTSSSYDKIYLFYDKNNDYLIDNLYLNNDINDINEGFIQISNTKRSLAGIVLYNKIIEYNLNKDDISSDNSLPYFNFKIKFLDTDGNPYPEESLANTYLSS
ncbi:MAG: hypothetical protein ACOCRK_10620, partial [bacterium]